MKSISIIGSTGSIGTQALEIIRSRPEDFQVTALSAGSNIALLIDQIKEFRPKYACISKAEHREELKALFPQLEILSDIKELAQLEVDIFLSAIVGIAGLEANLTAMRYAKRIAIANKETLVAAGHIVRNYQEKYQTELIPIDSEHVAIQQCLAEHKKESVKEILLTSSGGPFRTWAHEDFSKITLQDALKHPTWSMGSKITIDSSTLVNKGLEVIEAHMLFGVSYEQVKVVIHPESIVHSAVNFIDGNMMAQLAPPDMRIPIQYSLDYPECKEIEREPFTLTDFSQLNFEKPDLERFPALRLAYEAGKLGNSYTTVYNSANEAAVELFMEEKIHYLDIAKLIEEALNNHSAIKNPSLEAILELDQEIRNSTQSQKVYYNKVLMSKKKDKLPIGKIIIIIMLLSFLLTSILPIFAFSFGFNKDMSLKDKENLLSDISKKKKDVAKKLKEARKKEAKANEKLREIQRKLSQAQNRLTANRKYLEVNQDAWRKTKHRLDEIKIQRQKLETDAQDRVVSIYKQQRLKLIDGLMNSPSITDFLDHIYYQKRVIGYDQKVLAALVDQSETIKKYNETLASEARKISEISQKLRSTEREVAVQRNKQKEVVSKLQGERMLYETSERQLEKESIKLTFKITELAGKRGENPDATGSFIYPVKARITSPFGPRRHPIFGVRSMHSGIDLAAPRSTAIKASEGGLVIYSGWYGGYGKVVIVDHSKGYSSLYAHMSRTKVGVGERVKQGQVLGYEGETGYATGPHLHFEIRTKGKPQNPVNFIDS